MPTIAETARNSNNIDSYWKRLFLVKNGYIGIDSGREAEVGAMIIW